MTTTASYPSDHEHNPRLARAIKNKTGYRPVVKEVSCYGYG